MTLGSITTNAWLGSGTEVVERGVIEKIDPDSDGDTWEVDVRWSDGWAERFTISSAPTLGGRVSRTSRQGLFAHWGAETVVEK